MQSIRPQLAAQHATLAEDQPEYEPIRVAFVAHRDYPSKHPDGLNTVVMAFRPTDEERTRLAAGEDLYIGLLTFLQPMQPILVMVGKDEASEIYNVPIERETT